MSGLIKENPDTTEQFSDLFNDTFLLKTNSILGTLSEPIIDKFDLILTNPPYVTSGSSNIKEEIRKSGIESHYVISSLGVEGLFMEWVVRALKPGGKAFVVIPDGILTRSNDKNLRKFISDECFIDGIISLPEKTFFTTIKKTYILAVTKKTDKSIKQKDPVFTYLVSDIGETLDVYRFDTEINHLDDAAILFRQFASSKKHFKTNDNRCKTQVFDMFKPESHWAVDRWWTEQEKIDLGIIEEENKMSIIDFSAFIGEIANILLEYQSPLKELAEKKSDDREQKKIKLSDTSFFDLFIGKRVVKRDLIKIKGSIPLYSANVFNPVGMLEKSNIIDFNNEFVLWGIDGDFNFNYIKQGERFATTDHCGAIRIKTDKILPSYLLHQLNEVKKNYGYDRTLRASLNNMRDIEIQIPINPNGEFDLKKQKEIASIYSVILDLKQKIKDYKSKLESVVVEAERTDNIKLKEVIIGDILDSPPTNSGLKKEDVFLLEQPDSVPVYSATQDPSLTFGWVSKNSKWKKYRNVLAWNKDGSSGSVFYRKNEFVPYEKVKILKIKSNYEDVLDYEYLKCVIQSKLLSLGFGFNFKCSMDRVLKVEIPVPIDSDGNFDLMVQKEITKKYQFVEQVKKELEEKLNELLKISINI